MQEPEVEPPARMFRPSSSRAPLSSRRFRASFGVTLAFSSHCLSFKPQCWRLVHICLLGGIRRTEKDSRLSMVLFSCSASASHGLKSAPIDPFSTAPTGSSQQYELRANYRNRSNGGKGKFMFKLKDTREEWTNIFPGDVQWQCQLS